MERLISNEQNIDFKEASLINVELALAYLSQGDLPRAKKKLIHALDLNETEKYNKMLEEAKMYYEKSIPCFIQIYEMSQKPKERGRSAQFLMQMYMKTGQMDKYNEIKAEFK